MSMNVYLTGKNKATGTKLTDSNGNDAGRVVLGGVSSFTDTSASIAVSDSLAIEYTLDVSTLSELYIEIAVASQALDQFEIHARSNSSGSYQKFYSTAADYLAPKGLLIGTSGDLTAIAAAASGWFVMDVSALESLQLKMASSNVAGSTVDVYTGGH